MLLAKVGRWGRSFSNSGVDTGFTQAVIAGLIPRLSGSVFVDEAHGVDSTRSWTSASDPGHEKRIRAMRHENSVFRSVLKHVPWVAFDELVEAYSADARVRRLTMKSQFVALLYAQLAGAGSLREIVLGLESHMARLYHLGAGSVRRSTLSDANAQRPAAVFAELLRLMMQQAHRGLRRKLAETTYLIDATSVRLNERSAGWARFSAGVCGAKVHVIYDADADRPIYAAVSGCQRQRHHDSPADADRARSDLRIRSGLLRLCLVGQARRRPMPGRHPVESQYAARRDRGAAGAGGQRPFSPIASAFCPRARPRAGAIRCRMQYGKSV